MIPPQRLGKVTETETVNAYTPHTTASAVRILVLTSSFPRGIHDQDSLFLLRLCRELRQNGLDVRVLAPHAAGLRLTEDIHGIPIHRYRYLPERFETLAYGEGIISKLRRNPLRIFQAAFLMLGQQRALRRLVNTHTFDVIHAHWIIPQGLAAVFHTRKSGLRVIGTTHGSDMLILKGALANGLKRFVLKRLYALTVVNSAMADVARTYNADLPITIAPMGVDCDQFRPAPQNRSKETLHLLFVGYLVPLKGTHILIKALRTIINACPHVCLTIAGDGPQLRELQLLAEKNDLTRHVRFPGHIPHHQLPGLYARSDIFVSASLSEGMPITFLEAMASGCPVICGDIPGIRDAIVDDRTGYVVPLNDAGALAAKTIGLINDPEKRTAMSIEARKFSEAYFSWTAVGRRYAEILTKAAA